MATFLGFLLLFGISSWCGEASGGSGALFPPRKHYNLFGEPGDSRPNRHRQGRISIEGLLDEYEIDPAEVKTLRPDIFKSGYFSVFDALVSACTQNGVDIQYHFDDELKTHLIDSINSKETWWYAAPYHGGNRRGEEPVHRMDCHPYKDWMVIRVYPVSEARIGDIYAAFKAETERLEANQGQIVVPTVSIHCPGLDLDFTNVAVTAHGLRSDMFQKEVITAADVMISLAKDGELSLDLTWREEVGRSLVQGYYFTRFNNRQAEGRAGFTYELGEEQFAGVRSPTGRFGNNFFHMISDIRVIVSPEYVKWRWTDLSRRR